MNNTKPMRFVPSMDTTDEKAAKDAAYYGDCYMCKHHLQCSCFCCKSQRGLKYPIKGCPAKESAR